MRKDEVRERIEDVAAYDRRRHPPQCRCFRDVSVGPLGGADAIPIKIG